MQACEHHTQPCKQHAYERCFEPAMQTLAKLAADVTWRDVKDVSPTWSTSNVGFRAAMTACIYCAVGNVQSVSLTCLCDCLATSQHAAFFVVDI